VATPNASPPAEGSGDYNDTLVQIKSLKHRCVEPPSINASSEKILNINPNRKGYAINRNTGQQAAVKETNSKYKQKENCNLTGLCYKMERCCVRGNGIDGGRNKQRNNKYGNQGDEFHKQT